MKKLLAAVSSMFVLAILSLGQTAYANPAGAPSLSGKVVETMDSGGYTYCLIKDKSGQKTWVAVPQMKVKKGQDISFQAGLEMTNFTSKTLNRTFEKIYFSGGAMK
ncbi:MAG: hypothetical protein AB1553_01695 [Nitrospirota bacterium]